MNVIDKGHIYLLQNNKEAGEQLLMFYKDRKINTIGHSGTTNQEVCRALINRIEFLDNQKHHSINTDILFYLRQIIKLHEIRALEYKGYNENQIYSICAILMLKYNKIEDIPIGLDGHWIVPNDLSSGVL